MAAEPGLLRDPDPPLPSLSWPWPSQTRRGNPGRARARAHTRKREGPPSRIATVIMMMIPEQKVLGEGGEEEEFCSLVHFHHLFCCCCCLNESPREISLFVSSLPPPLHTHTHMCVCMCVCVLKAIETCNNVRRGCFCGNVVVQLSVTQRKSDRLFREFDCIDNYDEAEAETLFLFCQWLLKVGFE